MNLTYSLLCRCGLACLLCLVPAAAPAVTISSATISNYTGYIIAADAGDGLATTNRHRIDPSAQIDFGTTAGNYSVTWSLLDPAGTVMAATTTVLAAGLTGLQIVKGEVVPSASPRLTPGTLYRMKLDVLNISTNLIVATATEATGRTYLHFIGIVSGSAAFNTVTRVTGVTINRSWLLETDSSRQTIPVRVDYTVYRYDDWAGTNTPKDIAITLSANLLRDSDNTIQASTVTDNTATAAGVASFDSSVSPAVPTVVTGFKIIQVDPTAILAPNSYHCESTISHLELLPSTSLTGNTQSSATSLLTHFSGALKFGAGPTIATHFSSLAVAPVNTSSPYVPGVSMTCVITPAAGAGSVDGRTDYSFGGTAIEVNLANTGVATTLNTWAGVATLTPASGAAAKGNLNGVDYTRNGAAYLDKTGAHSAILASLPVGIGWAADRETGLLDSTVQFAVTSLVQTLDPQGTLSITPSAGSFFLCEETKPIYIETTSFAWHTTTGVFAAGAASTPSSIRRPLLDFINSYSALYADPSVGLKRSNDHLYNAVTTATNISFKKGSSGGGEMTAELALANTSGLLTHFPWNVSVAWGVGLQLLKVEGDLINSAGSQLTAPAPLVTEYQQHCQDSVEDGCGATKTAAITLNPTTNLGCTKDGGLQCSGSVATSLAWGWNVATGTYTHQVTSSFTKANFLMAGTFLRGDQNALADEDGPGVLLLSGFDPINLAVAERPATAAYGAGLGDYAGHNFRGSTFPTPPLRGHSTLQGTSVGDYDLTNRSKYYARYSGVSGIHESPTGPGAVALGGYLFSLNTYGFSFLSNTMEDSRTSGKLDIPLPCNFSLDFDSLQFSCLGALESFELTAGSSVADGKQFDRWDSFFTPMAVSFVSADECLPGAGTTMVLGFSGHASHFTTAFVGSLGIENTGYFARPIDHAGDAVPTRLQLAGYLTMTGTTGETYNFFPTQGAYFNHDPMAEGEGFWSLFGKLDVPFFDDMQVHLQTRGGNSTAGTADPETLSSIYLMGGWPAHGWFEHSLSPFDVTSFDENNAGRDVAVSLANYRSTTAESYLPRAQKLWLGVFNFDYPLVWSNTTFSFTGLAPITQNLLVLNTQHTLKYMDANNAEITFGVQYEGLPTMSLTNLAFNALDEATGVSSAFVDAAGDAVFRSLENGIDEFTKMLSDKMEDTIGDALTSLTSPIIAEFTDRVRKEVQNTGGTTDGLTLPELNALLNDYFRGGANQMITALNKLKSDVTTAGSTLKEIHDKLLRIEQTIDAVIHTLNTDPDTGAAIAEVHGLLEKYSVGGSPAERAIFKGLANALIDTLATAVSSSEVGDKINTFLAELEPTLEAVSQALTQVQTLVKGVREELEGVTGMADEFSDIITAAATQLQAASDAAAAEAEDLINALTTEDLADLNDIVADLNTRIAQALTDAIFGSQFVADLQESIKERIYDLQAAFNSAVDTAFAALNQMIRNALSEALAGVDDAIDEMLGDVAAYCGSGSLVGYAHINGDSLDELRIDGQFELKAPDALKLAAYLEIKELDSDGPASCGVAGDTVTEVTVAALDVGLGSVGMSGDSVRVNLGVKFALNGTTGAPIGLGGMFEMTSGTISFETFKITQLGASCMFGATENYFAATIAMEFGAYAMAGGIFLGHACTIDPLEMVDPLVAQVLTMPEFTGIYVYGEATFPIYGTGTCLFNISGKAGAGVFYFVEGPTYGGRLTMGVYGEALCAVEIGGEVSLVGLKSGDSYAFAGTGSMYGKAGYCPFCLEATFTINFSYTDAGGWSVDY
jgi:hypothetical protein